MKSKSQLMVKCMLKNSLKIINSNARDIIGVQETSRTQNKSQIIKVKYKSPLKNENIMFMRINNEISRV